MHTQPAHTCFSNETLMPCGHSHPHKHSHTPRLTSGIISQQWQSWDLLLDLSSFVSKPLCLRTLIKGEFQHLEAWATWLCVRMGERSIPTKSVKYGLVISLSREANCRLCPVKVFFNTSQADRFRKAHCRKCKILFVWRWRRHGWESSKGV